MFDQIIDDSVQTALQRGVIFGAIGSVGGLFLAQKMGYGTVATAGTIVLGHFAGHMLASRDN